MTHDPAAKLIELVQKTILWKNGLGSEVSMTSESWKELWQLVQIQRERAEKAESRAAAAEARATTAEAERDELAGALCNIWCNRYFTTCKGETLQQSRERCAAEFIDDAMIPIKTFDRLIAPPRT